MKNFNKINYRLNILFNDKTYVIYGKIKNSNKLEKITLC